MAYWDMYFGIFPHFYLRRYLLIYEAVSSIEDCYPN